MELQNLINSLDAGENPQEKVASADTASGALAAALEKTSSDTSAVPQSGNAVNDLIKVAENLVGTEKEAEVAHTQLLGQVFADAAITKFAAYDAQVKYAAAQEAQTLLEQEKYAAAQTPAYTEADLIKEAAEMGYKETMDQVQQESLLKEAAELGYAAAQEDLHKEASDSQAGYDAGLQVIHDTACAEFLKGAAVTEMVINQYNAQGR